MEEIVNRVANSTLVNLDLEEMYPKGNRVLFDLKDFLFDEAVLKEKDFRVQLKEHNWQQYKDCFVAISCSVDAIIPSWAYMLVATYLEKYAKTVIRGNLEQLESVLYFKVFDQMDWEKYRDAKVIIKGCSNLPVPESAYVEATRRLRPVAASIMYGEACSSVPLFKRSQKL